MPRILPRLLGRIAPEKDSWSPFILPRQKRKSLYKLVPPRPSFHPNDHARSILLSSPETNPITASDIYVQHKSLPPRPRVPKRARRNSTDFDHPRSMSDEELQWSSSPYLRMLASPIRRCIITNQYLPSDFLIRLAAMRVPPNLRPAAKFGTQETTLIPDGLQHPKFTTRRTGRASYMLCDKNSVSMLLETNAYKRIAHHLNVHSLLTEQISHLLRVRVLQEFQLLADHLDSLLDLPHQPSKANIIRRLTRSEWNSLRETGVIPYPNAVAVLIVPPLNKNPTTKTKPEPSMSTSPIAESGDIPVKPLLPLSTLHTSAPLETELFPNGDGDPLPSLHIPLYHGASLFPLPQQRAALHSLLTRLLRIEQAAGTQSHASTLPPSTVSLPYARDGRKASHAFLLSSDAETSRRGDVAAVAIALWRVQMFEG